MKFIYLIKTTVFTILFVQFCFGIYSPDKIMIGWLLLAEIFDGIFNHFRIKYE